MIMFDKLFDGGVPGKLFVRDHIIRILNPLIAFEDRLDDLSLGCRGDEFHVASDYFGDGSDVGRKKRFFHSYAFGMDRTESFGQGRSDNHVGAGDQRAELVLFEAVENLDGRSEMIFPYLFLDGFGPLGIDEIEDEK